MTSRRQTWAAIYQLAVGLVGWGALLVLWSALPEPLPILSLAFFALLSTAVKRLGVQVSPNVTHSLVGVIDLAALFIFGPVGGGIIAALSSGVCQLMRCQPWGRASLGRIFLASGLNVLMMLAAGLVYRLLGGVFPLQTVTWATIPAILGACLTHFVLDHLGWAAGEAILDGRQGFQAFLRGILPYSLLIELIPLPASVLISAAYLSFSRPLLTLMVLAILSIGLALRKLMISLQEEQRYVHEISAVSELGQALLRARLDLDEICRLIEHYCLQLVAAPTLVLQLRDPETGQITTPRVVLGERGAPASDAELGAGPFRWMDSRRCPTLVADFAVDHPFAPYEIGAPARSGLYAPIMIGERLLGLIALQSGEPQAFSGDDQKAVALIAAQAALGLHTAQLYRQEQERAKQLTIIAQVSRKVTAILNLQTLFADTVRLVQESFGYYHVSLFTVESGRQEVTFQASSSPMIQSRGVPVPWGQGIIGHAASTGQSVLVNNVSEEARFLRDSGLDETRSELSIPLKVDQRILGVLDLQSNRVGGFSAQDALVLQTLADQIAIAIEDSRLYAAQQEQAWVSTALLQVAEAAAELSTTEEILETTARLTLLLTGADRCLLFLWSEEDEAFTAVESAGLSAEQREALRNQRFAAPELPPLAQVLEEGQIAWMPASGFYAFLPPPLNDDLHEGQVAALPLRSKGQVIGVLVAEDGRRTDALPAHQQAILTGIANHAAMALENARLYAAQREEAWVSTALLQVAHMTSSATYDLDSAMSTIVRLTPMLVGVAWCAVLLWDEEREAFFGSQAHGLPRTIGDLFDGRYYTPESIPFLREVMNAAGPVTRLPLSLEEGHPSPADALGNQALTALPLCAREQLLGVLLAGHREGCHDIAGRRMNILTGIANQAALAIRTAQLYQQTVQQERLQREIELAREIQEGFLPECCPYYPGWQLGIEWRAARGVGGDFYDFIPLGERRLGLVIADVSDKGVAAALYMALSRTVMRAAARTSSGPAETLSRVNEILLQDSRSGMFVSLFYGIVDLDTGEMRYARAGHNPPLWVRAEDQSVTALESRGAVLGVLENAEIEEGRLLLAPGDVLVTYTDGVTEAMNELDEEFGEERLIRLAQHAPAHTAESLVNLIDAAVRVFTGERPQFDDFTLVVFKRNLDGAGQGQAPLR